MGGTAGPIPAEQRGGAPAGHDPEGQRFPQRSRCPRWAVAAPDGRSSPRSQGGPTRQRPQHPCGERQPSGAVSGPAPPPFHGHPLLRHGRLPPSLFPSVPPPRTRENPSRRRRRRRHVPAPSLRQPAEVSRSRTPPSGNAALCSRPAARPPPGTF